MNKKVVIIGAGGHGNVISDIVLKITVINTNANAGNHRFNDTKTIVEHKNVISDYSYISVRSKLGGTVTIARKTWMCTWAAVKKNVSIFGGYMSVAKTVVVNDIKESGTYLVFPAERIDMEENTANKFGGEISHRLVQYKGFEQFSIDGRAA